MSEKLKPCPACGAAAGYDEDLETGPAFCPNDECLIGESHNDFGYEVSRWNALPRRDDQPHTMSDIELQALIEMVKGIPPTIINLDGLIEPRIISCRTLLLDELDRRDAMRKAKP